MHQRFSARQCSQNRGPVGNSMFPRAQERPKGASGTKWEPGGPILLNKSNQKLKNRYYIAGGVNWTKNHC